MITTKSKLIPVRASGRCITRCHATVQARSHTIEIDEPIQTGGTDAGPMPLETLMASLVGCTNVISHRIAGELGIQLKELSVQVTGLLDYGVILGVADSRVAFPELTLRVAGRSDATPDQLELLKEQLATRCPVSVLFRGAGTRIEEVWEIAPLD